MIGPARPHDAPAASEVPLTWGSLATCFSVDEFTGASQFSAPLRLTPGRSGLDPDLSLRYDARWGNGPFGLGWRLDPPAISRAVRKEVPRYRDNDEDEYEIDGAQLVPALRKAGGAHVEDRFVIGEYVVQRYRRRDEAGHDRIERWTHQPSGQTHWRRVDKENVTSLFGVTDDCRVSDAADHSRTGRWLLSEKFDDRGNIVRYTYKAENLEGVDLEERHERHRIGRADAHGGSQYLKTVQYGNAAPHERARWHFTIVLDYGEHDDEAPTPEEVQPWAVRPDPFSANRIGFELRQWRRCRRILQFHDFEDLGPEPTLVNATRFDFDDSTGRSLLNAMVHTGYVVSANGSLESKSLPAVTFSYNLYRRDDTVRTLESDVLLNTVVDPNSRAHWIDLHGEGLPGVMARLGTSWYYTRNLGNGRFADPELVIERELEALVDDEILDVDREAQRSLAHERQFQPTTTFRNTANVNQDDPYIGYLDLNGDSADDVVVADDRVIRWYPSQGEDGFGDPVVLHLEQGEHTRSHRLYSDKKQSFHVADMTGDGLYDLVRVRSGEICYWPNQGRGRFGERVVMSGAPTFPGDAAGDSHVLLVDLDGRWTTDLVWIGDGEIRYWENLSGNRWANSSRVVATGIESGATGTAAVDITGSGCASIVWVDRTGEAPKLRYVTPASTQRSDLLAQIDNGRGLSVDIEYSSSTEFWLRDRAEGGSWLTALPEPVHMVEKVSYVDAPADTRLEYRYAYHHGHYDSDDVRFAGFALTERWETNGLLSRDDVRPKVLTKTWRHTGTQFEDADLTVPLKEEFFQDAFLGRRKWLSGNQMPLAQQAKDIPHAHRALRGQLLRQELYTLDGPPSETVPHVVTERTAWVRVIQPGRSSEPPCFDVRQNECVTVRYERDVQEPRVEHQMTLALDECGFITREVTVAYGRSRPEHEAQGRHLVHVVDRHYLHRGEQPTWYRIGALSEQTTWELVNVPSPVSNRLYETREIKGLLEELPIGRIGPDIQPPHRRLIAKERHRYWSNDLTQVLPLGKLESFALPARIDRLALTPDLIANVLRDEAANILLADGGYVRDEDGLWAPGDTTVFDAARFYLPSTTFDCFGNATTYEWDASGLARTAVRDPYGNTERAQLNERTLNNWLRTDVNGNVIGERYDALGMVLSTAVIGKPELGEADALALSSMEASAHDDPTTVVTYDAHAWANVGQPTWIRARHRERHGDETTSLVDTVIFLDGHERILWTATRNHDEKWIVDGAVQRDGRGRIIRRAAPFFSDHPAPEPEVLDHALAAGTRYTYDSLDRVVRTDLPNGTFETNSYRPWAVIRSDAGDTVLESDWYSERQSATQGRAGDFAARQAVGAHYAARVAALSSAHARTPAVDLLDGAGRVCVVRTELSGGALVEDRVVLDAFDRVVQRFDRRGVVSSQDYYDLLGRPIEQTTLEGGTTTRLVTADGLPLRIRDPLGRILRYQYDRRRRLTHVIYLAPDGTERVLERYVYGGGDVDISDARRLNSIGRLALRLSAAGLDTYAYDFNGSLVLRSHRSVRQHRSAPDWSLVNDATRISDIEATIDAEPQALLLTERFQQRFEYDALVRTTRAVGPDSSSLEYRYGAHGLPERIGVRMPQVPRPVLIAESLRHDASGHLTAFSFGSGTQVRRRVDTAGREVESRVTHEGKVLRDATVLHDATGNLSSMTDRGRLVAAYTYDAEGVLTRAEGLEQADDSDELVNYSETYAYNTTGNLTAVDHRSSARTWSATYDHRSDNRLRAMTHTEDASEDLANTYQHDDAGRLIREPDGTILRWNLLGLLSEVENETRGHAFLLYDDEASLRRRIVDRPGGIIDETVVSGAFERRRRLHNGKVVFEQFVVAVEHDGVPLSVVERTTVPMESPDATVRVRNQIVDQCGSVVLELDVDGSVITETLYRPFGEPAVSSGRTVIESATRRHGFLGGRQDADSGMTVIGGRWYAPRLARFVAPEPSVTDNRYRLNRGNPQGAHAHRSNIDRAFALTVLGHFGRLLGGPGCGDRQLN